MWLWKARPPPAAGTAAVGGEEAERWRPTRPGQLASEDRDICFATNQEQQRADLKMVATLLASIVSRVTRKNPPPPLALVGKWQGEEGSQRRALIVYNYPGPTCGVPFWRGPSRCEDPPPPILGRERMSAARWAK
jgi:hypothetical protein